jgi:hypothetical protein
MASLSVERKSEPRAGQLLLARAAGEGSAAHPWFASPTLLTGAHAARNLADAVHLLCTLHGRHPGVIDLGAKHTADPDARAWLLDAGESFATERLYLTRLAVAAGPIPGTPGGSASEAAVQAQRAALATLTRSERAGCAFGAALALAADWGPIRSVLDTAARRLGIEAPPCRLAGLAELRSLADRAAASPPVERALLFGAQQILVQHHGLWGLLEARAQARGGA